MASGEGRERLAGATPTAQQEIAHHPTRYFTAAELRTIFQEMVRVELANGVLRHSKRRELLRFAEQLGIGQFEACVIVAQMQYRADQLEPPQLLSDEEVYEHLVKAQEHNATMRRLVLACGMVLVMDLWIWQLVF
ncbi:MAG: hypothetical protein HJJLKODD_00841 [Phycisphaerae bacterium]|nr:hypothetical protein [Phycisphaerae bacterium]